METPTSEEITHETDGGVRLSVRSFCSVDMIRQLEFDAQFGVHAQYKSLYTKRESLEMCATLPDANVSLALADGSRIVGFGVLVPPEPDERWAAMGEGTIMEVKAIEVCRHWRTSGVGRSIMQMLMRHPALERLIVYMVGYSWTWDLDGEGISALEYRQKLIALFSRFGFLELPTNEPNVSLRPENLFMSRVGAEVPADRQQRFKWLRFGIDEG